MPDPIKENRRLAVNPRTGDVHRAEDILDEIQAVCRKYLYTLAHVPQGIMLAKYEEPPNPCRVIAVVKQITPNAYWYNAASGDLVQKDQAKVWLPEKE